MKTEALTVDLISHITQSVDHFISNESVFNLLTVQGHQPIENDPF